MHPSQSGDLTLALGWRSQGRQGGGVPAAVLEAVHQMSKLDLNASKSKWGPDSGSGMVQSGKEGGGVPAAVLEAAPSRAQLDQHASGQWEVVLWLF